MIRPTLKRSIICFAALAIPATAQDFSEGSEAREWGLYAEQKALFTATVTDPLCVLAGDCADNCGAGNRQVVLVREADDVMIFPLKNAQSAFNGAVADLAPFCGQTVDVDGLLIEDPEIGAMSVYMVQRIRPEGGDWQRANTWTDDWAWFDDECYIEAPRGEVGGNQNRLMPLNFFSGETAPRKPLPLKTSSALILSALAGAALAELW